MHITVGGLNFGSLVLMRHTGTNVLARIQEMPVQKSNFKISARPNLDTNSLQFHILTTFNSIFCQKRQFTLQLCPRRCFVRKIFGDYSKKAKIDDSS